MWTLIFGSLYGVETFTIRKLMGVLASLAGIVLISMVDLSGQSDENRGTFPHKSISQIALGDTMAFVSAIVYGIYVTVMKKRVGNEDRVDMRLFFGLVGLFILTLLWPVFIILHLTGVETVRLLPIATYASLRVRASTMLTLSQFELPPNGRVWFILIVRCLDIISVWKYPVLTPNRSSPTGELLGVVRQ
jgi:drug/metabolite transporter (DMT)-like permease